MQQSQQFQNFVQAVQEQLDKDVEARKRIGATGPDNPKWWLV